MLRYNIKLFQKKIFVILALSILLGCTDSDKEKIKDEDIFPKIYFKDQKELTIDDKYFTILVDSQSMDSLPYFYPERTYRFDLEGTHSFWQRSYNRMTEIRFSNLFNEKEDKSFNYLFGLRKFDNYKNNSVVLKAFYMKWRNEMPRPPKLMGAMPVTSDISKYTVELISNLPEEILKNYYPDLTCPIVYRTEYKAKLSFPDFNLWREYDNPFKLK